MREMSVLEDYEIVDAALRDRLAALKADIDSMTGGAATVAYLINPPSENGLSWSEAYLQTDGTSQSGYTNLSNWDSDMFKPGSSASTNSDGTWKYSVPIIGQYNISYGNWAGFVFDDPIDCRDYKYLKVKYYNYSQVYQYCYNRSYINLAKDKTVGEDGQTANNYKTIEVSAEPGYYDGQQNNVLWDANSNAWKWVTIDISDLDEFYLSLTYNGCFYVAQAYLTNEGPAEYPNIIRSCSDMLWDHFGLKNKYASHYVKNDDEYCMVYCHWLDYNYTDNGFPVRPLTVAFARELPSVGYTASDIQSAYGTSGLPNGYTYVSLRDVLYVTIENLDLSDIVNDPVAVTKYVLDNISPSSLIKADYVHLQNGGQYSWVEDSPGYLYNGNMSMGSSGNSTGQYCMEYNLMDTHYLPVESEPELPEPSVEPVWIVNPDGTTWDDMYLQTDGTPQEGSFRISGDYADFSFMSNYSEEVINTWVYKLVYGGDGVGSMVFISPIDCSNYSKLRIKYYVCLRGVYDMAYANVMLIKDIDANSNTIGETYNTIDLKTAYAAAINGNGIPSRDSDTFPSIGQNADNEAWKYIDIDVSDIDEFYLGFRVFGIDMYIVSIQLTNE